MKTKFDGNHLIVTREPSDPKFHGVRNAAGESALLYAIKQHLNAKGYDLIKKRMASDGHMVSEYQQYLRTRSANSPGPNIAIYSGFFAIRGANEDFNEGRVVLEVAHNFIGKKKAKAKRRGLGCSCGG